ncbi:MAG: XdhC family protein [Bacteroidales bacterium]|nr:MAG: XdhC family protein [Bacteroidales bacterium]
MTNLLLKISDCYKDPRSSALCIVTNVSGSTPGKAGAKMIVYSDGSIEGTVGGGSIEKTVIADALNVIKSQTPLFKEYNLKTDLSMICGGALGIYIEPISKPAKLFIFGAGHIGKYIAHYAPDMGFDTTLIDWREDIFEDPENIRYAQICKPYLEAIKDISFDDATYCVIVTPNHEMDEDVLAALGKRTSAYLGLIGSKRKIETLRKHFLQERILAEEELNRVDMPIGIKFNAITPAEIAVSIIAKLIDVKNTKA